MNTFFFFLILLSSASSLSTLSLFVWHDSIPFIRQVVNAIQFGMNTNSRVYVRVRNSLYLYTYSFTFVCSTSALARVLSTHLRWPPEVELVLFIVYALLAPVPCTCWQLVQFNFCTFFFTSLGIQIFGTPFELHWAAPIRLRASSSLAVFFSRIEENKSKNTPMTRIRDAVSASRTASIRVSSQFPSATNAARYKKNGDKSRMAQEPSQKWSTEGK